MNTPKSREITVRYRWTKEELRDAYNCERKASVSPVSWWIFVGIVVLLLLSSVANFAMGGFNSHDGFELALTFALAVSVLQIGSPLARVAKHFRKHNDLNADLNWAVTPEGLECRVGKEVKHRFDWSDVLRVGEGEKGVLLYPAPKTFYWFPFHAFATPEDRNTFLEYALVRTEAELFHA